MTTPHDEPTPAPTFRFTDLPIELRLLVERISIAMGNLAIADTSQAIRREAAPLVDHEAIYRIRIYTPNEPWYNLAIDLPFLTTAPTGHIQNIQITVDFTNFFFLNGPQAYEVAPVLRFASSIVKKENCILLLKEFDFCMHRDQARKMLRILEPLSSFQHIFVTALAGQPLNRKDRSLEVEAPPITRARSRGMYDVVKEEWEATFGPSIWHESERPADRFHPQGYR